eukprot:Gregarina_sp_Poly_1__3913@NODE_2170_length_2564_cov_79_219864_g1399_i0_p1_GENE_NODE_2170_length_2564_cov_79_219864_g1399_i0NODE_2170_length_2564_cov_79_219864_g1399_i0_p1_ORF_typecomplete_len268_score37_94EFhand_6/PF13405_6/0_2_NODE_2170_length_2564_cov_79_219864_g1399_i014022205
MESCQKIFLGPEMVTDSNDEQLEYFPQDGYDYDQHFVNDKNRIGFTSFIIEPDNIQAKWKDPVFTGVLEKPVAEMDEDELEIFELLQSDSKEEKENTINHQSDGDDAAEEFFKSILPKGKQLDNITRQALWGQPLWFEETPPMRIGALTAKNLKRIERDEIGSDLSYIASESEDPDTITKTDKLHIDEEEFQRALRGLSDGSSCDEGRVIWTKDTDESLVNMQHDNSYEAHQIHNLNLIAEDFVARESRRQEELTLNQIQPLGRVKY